MSTQREIDVIMICLYMGELSCTIQPCTNIKSKTGGKILSQKHVKTSFYRYYLVH